MSNLSTIVNFFASKGLPKYLIAGIVGNLKVESGFDPGAYNSGEGAIGIAQWEGGRRTALQQWASQHGGSESDLNTQLSFLWHEMHSTESAAWDTVRQAGSASEAAALWDANYERSSGEARQDRVSAAVEWFKTGKISGGDYTTSGESSRQLSGGGQDLNRSDFAGVDSLGDLLDQIPELSKLVDTAMQNDWSLDKFQNAIEDSKWWKHHSSTARQVLIEKANDPASWGQDVRNTRQSINTLAHQLGFELTGDQLNAIATSALMSGNGGNQQWLTQQIGRRQDYSHLGNLGKLQGGMAATAQQLQQMAGDYGFKWDASETARRAQDILMGRTTIDTYKERLTRWAMSAFPSLAREIKGGATVKELADPYVQSMSQLLEVNPGSIDLFTPKIRKALQGTPQKDGQLAQTPLWQFEQELRGDPRWAYTSNAHQQIASTLLQIGSAFGFDG